MSWLKKAVVVGAIVGMALPANAEVCTRLGVVEGKGAQTVQKKVSVPGTPTSRSNWNTDFAVPSGTRFTRYVATIVPINGGKYRIQLNLKYPNKTADTVYDKTVEVRDRQTLTLSGSPRLNASPYQVNLSVGGVEAVGNSYTATVSGCR